MKDGVGLDHHVGDPVCTPSEAMSYCSGSKNGTLQDCYSEVCDSMSRCPNIQKLIESIGQGDINRNLADQYENLCTDGIGVNSGALPCLTRDSLSTLCENN
tara:strand:+ start:5164 stop:5466 length:303 start_codon:yes stop_codon:yes gene_type:complete